MKYDYLRTCSCLWRIDEDNYCIPFKKLLDSEWVDIDGLTSCILSQPLTQVEQQNDRYMVYYTTEQFIAQYFDLIL